MTTRKEIELDENFKEFIELLNLRKVKYLLVGGFAVGLHGYPRHTGDLDIWIDAEIDNAHKIIDVFAAFGFASIKLSVEDFCKRDMVHQFGYPPLRIDVLTGVSGLKFAECFPRKKRMKVNGIWINVVHLSDLKLNKLASGRPEDLFDVKKLEQIKLHDKKSRKKNK